MKISIIDILTHVENSTERFISKRKQHIRLNELLSLHIFFFWLSSCSFVVVVELGLEKNHFQLKRDQRSYKALYITINMALRQQSNHAFKLDYYLFTYTYDRITNQHRTIHSLTHTRTSNIIFLTQFFPHSWLIRDQFKEPFDTFIARMIFETFNRIQMK